MSAVLSSPTHVRAGGTGALACPSCGASAPGLWFPDTSTCVPCKGAHVRAQAMAVECDQLAHEIAMDCAMQRLQRMALVTGDGWYDVNFALLVSGPESTRLQRDIQYLLFRGHLVLHPTYTGLYKVIPSNANAAERAQ